jgi:hypothetical protein
MPIQFIQAEMLVSHKELLLLFAEPANVVLATEHV